MATDRDATREPEGYDEQLVAWGKALRLATIGRRSGRRAHATLGFVEEADGSLLVAASDPRANWALNLLADPRCDVTVRDKLRPARAEPLDGPERARAVVELILRYGTPSERLGAGPVFRLRPGDASRD